VKVSVTCESSAVALRADTDDELAAGVKLDDAAEKAPALERAVTALIFAV
jgi:hypothetical protein